MKLKQNLRRIIDYLYGKGEIQSLKPYGGYREEILVDPVDQRASSKQGLESNLDVLGIRLYACLVREKH